jgi:hypothetical protein
LGHSDGALNWIELTWQTPKYMTPEDQPTDETSRGAQKNPGSEGFIKDVGKELLRDIGTTIKWAIGGAFFGAIVLGGFGLWKFGVIGLGIGAIVGAVIGGATGGWAYFSAGQ